VYCLEEKSVAQEPGTARSDLQQNVRLLSKLSTPLHAVTSLLASHEQALELFLKSVRSSSGINSDDFELLGTISQRVFGALPFHVHPIFLCKRLWLPKHHEVEQISTQATFWQLCDTCWRMQPQHLLQMHSLHTADDSCFTIHANTAITRVTLCYVWYWIVVILMCSGA
jgi:hypothetical protein